MVSIGFNANKNVCKPKKICGMRFQLSFTMFPNQYSGVRTLYTLFFS